MRSESVFLFIFVLFGMPVTIDPDRELESTTVPLGAEGGESFDAADLRDEGEHKSFEPAADDGSFMHISRLFLGAGLSCLNLPVEVPNLASVAELLNQNQSADEAIVATYNALRDTFDDCTIRLETYPDPEGERPVELALVIETQDEPEVALEKLSQFDEEFWIDHIGRFDDLLSVHLEYQ